MSIDKQTPLRKRIGIFYQNNIKEGKLFTLNHFLRENVGRTMIYEAMKRVDNGKSLDRRPGSGSNNAIPQKTKDKVIKECLNKVARSEVSIAKQFKISNHSVKKILLNAGIKKKKRIKAPKSSESQKIRQKKCSEKLRRGPFKPSENIEIIIDDETYLTLDGSDNYNAYYYSQDGVEASDSVKYKFITKFSQKVLVWAALSSRGLSQAFITKSGNSINSQIYIKECIKKRLTKFIDKHHSDGNFIFWPDLASSHYSKQTLEELKRLKINVVPKDSNPPNVPQVRPIEHYWAILKKRVYRNGWRAESVEELIKKVKLELRRTSPKTCQNLMRSVKSKVRKAADHGPLSLIN